MSAYVNTMVSIIVPVFNKDRSLQETIESVIAQTYPLWELILVDDGSTDDSIAICQEYQNRDNRIKFFQRQSANKGGSVCRNIGINNANGEYVIFLDADDVIVSTCLERRVAIVEQQKDNDFVVFQMGIMGEDACLTKKKSNYLYAFLSHDLPWTITAPIWKKNILQQLAGYDETYPRLQDPEMHTRALLLPNINFSVIESSADCFYRIGYKKVDLEILLQGYVLYLRKIGTLVKGRTDERICLAKLDICRKSAMNQIIRGYDKTYSHKPIMYACRQINQEAYQHGICAKYVELLTNMLIGVYVRLYPLCNRWLFHKVLNKLL